MAKINIPLSQVSEAEKIREILYKTTRSTSGNISWTSPSSGITYDTSTSADVTIKNKGELGLMNMLVLEYEAAWLLVADDINNKADVDHTHGIITGDTAGTDAGKAIYTSTGGAIIAGTLPVTGGGSGKTSVTTGALLKGNGNSAMQEMLGTGALFAATSGSPEFGVLPVALGGTGQTSMASLRNQLGLGNSVGPLAVANGGTGVSSLDELRSALGLGSAVNSPLPVANGGTGATTASAARNNIGAAATQHTHAPTDLTAAVPINLGGTGATTKAAAKTNLGITAGTAAPSGGDNGDIYFQYV